MSDDVGQQLAAISRWVDDSPANSARDAEARTWGRLAKVAEECGEVIQAYIGVTGQNPRKGVTNQPIDVRKELLDVAATALAAYEHLTGNEGDSMDALARHVAYLAERAGIHDVAKCPNCGRQSRSYSRGCSECGFGRPA